jgi:hypothetical protein
MAQLLEQEENAHHAFPHIDNFEQHADTIKNNLKEGQSSVMSYKGHIKVHGSNHGIVFNPLDGEMYIQGRNRVIHDGNNDVHKFTAFFEEHKGAYTSIFKELIKITGNNQVVMYGEFAGKQIQPGAGVSEVDPFFYIFGVLVKDKPSYWLDVTDHEKTLQRARIVNKAMFPTFEAEVDYNKLDEARVYLNAMTMLISKKCPVAWHFGVKDGIGEGIVWYCTSTKSKNTMSNLFKTKGPEVAPTLILEEDKKTIKSNIDAFFDKTVTDVRCEQGIAYLKEIGEPITIRSIREFMFFVVEDILREESELIKSLKVNHFQLRKAIGSNATKWYGEYIKKLDTLNNISL